jgi:hypothetical protein
LLLIQIGVKMGSAQPTIYIPLIAFLAAVGWMVWRGFEAKKEYLRSKHPSEQAGNNTEEVIGNIKPRITDKA